MVDLVSNLSLQDNILMRIPGQTWEDLGETCSLREPETSKENGVLRLSQPPNNIEGQIKFSDLKSMAQTTCFHVCLDCFGPSLELVRRKKKEHSPLLELSVLPQLKMIILWPKMIVSRDTVRPQIASGIGALFSRHSRSADATQILWFSQGGRRTRFYYRRKAQPTGPQVASFS